MKNSSAYKNIFITFSPHIIKVNGLNHVSNNLIICGEMHGAIENANLLYTICNILKIKCLAVEYSSSIDGFIKSAVKGTVDFSAVNISIFDSSMMSIEMLKTIVELLKHGIVQQIEYLDDTFDLSYKRPHRLDPKDREKHIANNILALDRVVPTLCIMGNWHARPNKIGDHISALRIVRQSIPDAALIYYRYREGNIRNNGSIIELPLDNKLQHEYLLTKKSKYDYDLVIPVAHPTQA